MTQIGFQHPDELGEFIFAQVTFRKQTIARMPENSAFWAVKDELLEELDILKISLESFGMIETPAPAKEP